MSNLTVILPCAGEGTRLSLPYPKEVHSIEKNKSLIDYSFDLFSNYGRRDVEFVITLNENKTELVKYLSRYKSRYNISFTFFNPAETEYTGSIKSAKHLFGEKNLVLLPDTFMKLKSSQDIVNLVSDSLNETGFTFFFKRERSELMLRTKGALSIDDDNLVQEYDVTVIPYCLEVESEINIATQISNQDIKNESLIIPLDELGKPINGSNETDEIGGSANLGKVISRIIFMIPSYAR